MQVLDNPIMVTDFVFPKWEHEHREFLLTIKG